MAFFSIDSVRSQLISESSAPQREEKRQVKFAASLAGFRDCHRLVHFFSRISAVLASWLFWQDVGASDPQALGDASNYTRQLSIIFNGDFRRRTLSLSPALDCFDD